MKGCSFCERTRHYMPRSWADRLRLIEQRRLARKRLKAGSKTGSGVS